MRVALFTDTFLPKLDGIVTVICLLLDHLALRGVESVIVAPKLGDAPSHYADTRVISVPGVPLPLYPELRIAPPTPATYRQLRAFQPEVAHILAPVIVGTAGLFMARRLGVPALASFHLDMAQMAGHYRLGFLRPAINLATRLAFNSADTALAPSRRVQRELRAIGVREVGLWGRGVDAERFNPRHRDPAMRDALSDGHPDAAILLYVGRLSSEKRIDLLRPLLDAVPDARLALVGDGPERARLEALFAGTPTRFMGYLRDAALSAAYASADVFVFPSALETFGLVVTEAMAAGLPVVASRVGGVPDVVQEGHTGYTFEVGDDAGLIAGVRQIITDRDRLAMMSQAARAYAETQTWPVMMDEVIAHYARLIALRRARG